MSTPKKTLTAAERAAKLQAMLVKEEQEAAERKQKLTEQIAAQAAKAEAEAVAAAAKAARNASLAVFGVPAMKEKSVTRMSAAKRLELMMAQNEGRATNVVDPAAVKKAAEEAFKALSAPKKIEYLRAKAAADVAEAEAKLAVYRAKVEERLARDIAAVQKEAGSPAEALSDLVSAMSSSSSSSMAASPSAAKAARRTTQQVFNNLQRELAYEEGRIARRARGEELSPRLGTRKRTPERVIKLRANLAASQLKLNSAATRKMESLSKKSASKQKANSNAAALEAYMRTRAEKKKAEASGAASASSRSNE
jgi:hypothetical protein